MKNVIGVFCILATLFFSEVNPSRIDGVVTDPSGAAVPGAEVTVTNLATDQNFKTTTDERGEWALPSMAAATYKIAVSKPGFKAGLAPGIEVNARVPATVNIKIQGRPATPTVEVGGGAGIVQAFSATAHTT